MASVNDPVHRSDVPPPIDLAGHMRELGRAFFPALVIGLLVGAAVFFARTELSEKQYSASIVTEIKPAQALVPGDAFIEQMRAPFIGLASDNDVLEQVVSEVDTDWTAGTLASNLALEPGTSPALLVFTVTAPSPELALQLTQSTVSTVAQAANANSARDTQSQLEQLQAAVAAEEARNNALPDGDAKTASNATLSDLRGQLAQVQSGGGDQLVVLSTPEQSDTPVSPKPFSEASVAALAALVIAAELIVLLRSRIGSRPTRAWASRVAKKYRASFDPQGGDALPPSVVGRIAARERGGPRTSGSARHSAPGRDGYEAVILIGQDAESNAGSTTPIAGYAVAEAVPPQDGRAFIEGGLASEWWTVVDVADVESAVVILSKGGKDRKAAEHALRRLHEFAVPTYLVLQQASSKRRKKSAEPQNAEAPSDDN